MANRMRGLSWVSIALLAFTLVACGPGPAQEATLPAPSEEATPRTSSLAEPTPAFPSSAKATAAARSWAEAMSNGWPTLAEFGRGTCIPCKEMKPILEEVARDYSGKLNVVIVSVDDYRDLTSKFRIMAIPTQVFLDGNGKEVSRHVGLLAKDDIIVTLAKMGIR